MIIRNTIFPIILLIAFSACGDMAGEDLVKTEIRQLYSSANCGVSSPNASLKVLSSQEMLDASLAQMANLNILVESSLVQAAFEREDVIQINMGQKNTGGYGLGLLDTALQLENDRGIIQVHWHEPKPGAMLIQVVTSPCLFIAMPRQDLKGLKVVDQFKQSRLEVDFKYE